MEPTTDKESVQNPKLSATKAVHAHGGETNGKTSYSWLDDKDKPGKVNKDKKDKKNIEKMENIFNESFTGLKKTGTYLGEFYGSKKSQIFHYSKITLGVLSIVVLFQNLETSQFNLLFWSFSSPKIVLLFGMLAIGVILGYWLHGKSLSTYKHE